MANSKLNYPLAADAFAMGHKKLPLVELHIGTVEFSGKIINRHNRNYIEAVNGA
jgi:hypothetical protein